MELTLDYIAESLGGHVVQHASGAKRTYRCALFGDCALPTVDPHALYVVSGMPSIGLVESGAGLIITDNPPNLVAFPQCDIAAIDEKRSAPETLNEITRLFEKCTGWEQQINKFNNLHDGLQRACDLMSEIFDAPTYFVDDGFKVLAIKGSRDAYESGYVWKHLVDDGYIPWNVVEELVSKKEISVMEAESIATLVDVSSFNTPFINLPIRNRGKLLGFFFVVGLSRRLDQRDVELLNALAPMLTNVFINNANIALLRGERHEGFVRDGALGKVHDRDEIKNRARLLSIDAEGTFAACLFDIEGKHDLMRTEIFNYLEGDSTYLVVSLQEAVLVLTTLSKRKSFQSASKRLEQLAHRVGCRAAISDVFTGLYDLPTYYQQAKLALPLANEAHATQFRDLYFPALTAAIDSLPGGSSVFVNRDALAIAQYDRQYGTDYAGTLLHYVLNDCNSVRAAEALHIHRSTLTYRLERIKEICSFDFSDRDKLFATTLSIYLLDIDSA